MVRSDYDELNAHEKELLYSKLKALRPGERERTAKTSLLAVVRHVDDCILPSERQRLASRGRVLGQQIAAKILVRADGGAADAPCGEEA